MASSTVAAGVTGTVSQSGTGWMSPFDTHVSYPSSEQDATLATIYNLMIVSVPGVNVGAALTLTRTARAVGTLSLSIGDCRLLAWDAADPTKCRIFLATTEGALGSQPANWVGPWPPVPRTIHAYLVDGNRTILHQVSTPATTSSSRYEAVGGQGDVVLIREFSDSSTVLRYLLLDAQRQRTADLVTAAGVSALAARRPQAVAPRDLYALLDADRLFLQVPPAPVATLGEETTLGPYKALYDLPADVAASAFDVRAVQDAEYVTSSPTW
jgi:hypothetical protein